MSTRLKIFSAISVPAVIILGWWLFLPLTPPTGLQLFALLWLVFGLAWLLRSLLRVFLWRVSRRLAFSYFLIGIVPIPLVGCLVAVALYILSGFFLGHLYSDSLDSLQNDLQSVAQVELDRLLGQLGESTFSPAPARFAYYRDGRRFAGDSEAPALFRLFLPRADNGEALAGVPVFADSQGNATLFAAARNGRYAIVARLDGSLEDELRRRMGLWIELARADSGVTDEERVVFNFGGRKFPLEALQPAASSRHIDRFFNQLYGDSQEGSEAPRRFESSTEAAKTDAGARSTSEEAQEASDLGFIQRPWLVWLELTRPFLDPSTGASADEYLTATLVSSPYALAFALLPAAPEVNFFVYLVFATVFLITLNVYIIALIMALMMIFSLSRAVNRLTDATRQVQQGDFSARIEVFRNDQIGALQKGFNQMAANLEQLVEQAAQKEIFERELEIAAQMQHSLLPDTLEAPAPLRFATCFRPSRAIGGDYFDLLPLADGRTSVAIADVAGHGLPAGLRMAMVKSAIELLCQEHGSPKRILERLHHLLRYRLQKDSERRAFVTATIAAFDLENRRLEIVGAGHPPTYRLRDGEVDSFELPGPPLGILPPTLPSVVIDALPGDVYLWLSDGLIEATNGHDEAFGYQRIEETLTGLKSDPELVRDKLLAAVSAHTGEGQQVDDDLTLVVVRWEHQES